jgi:arylsulfatase A-like enzyme
MMLDYAGVPTPDYMHGRSFRSIMETGQEPKDWKKVAYYAHIGIRTKKFKLLYFYGAKQKETEATTPPGWELYNLESDPGEMNNLYDNPEYAQVIEKLKAELKSLRKQYGEDDPKYACNKVIAEFWDYDDAARQKAIKVSHTFLKECEERFR